MMKYFFLESTSSTEYVLFLESRNTLESAKAGIGLTIDVENPDFSRNRNVYGFKSVENGEIFGFVEFYISHNITASVSLNILPKHQKKGLGTKFHESAIAYLFEELNMRGVYHYILPSNQKMIHIIEQYGFNYCGTFRNYSRNIPFPHTKEQESDYNRICLLYDFTKEQYEIRNQIFKPCSAASYPLLQPESLDAELTRLAAQASITSPPILKYLEGKFKKNDDFKFVDLGCGAGHLLKVISEAFPNSRCLGIDKEIAVIEQAKNITNVEVKLGNLLSDPSLFSKRGVYLLNLVAQHLAKNDLNSIFRQFNKSAPVGSKLIIQDTDDRLWNFLPRCHGIETLLTSANVRQIRFGGSRTIGLDCIQQAQLQGLAIEHFEHHTFSNKTLGDATFFSIIDILLHKVGDPYFLSNLSKKELIATYEDWKKNKSKYANGSIIQSVFVN